MDWYNTIYPNETDVEDPVSVAIKTERYIRWYTNYYVIYNYVSFWADRGDERAKQMCRELEGCGAGTVPYKASYRQLETFYNMEEMKRTISKIFYSHTRRNIDLGMKWGLDLGLLERLKDDMDFYIYCRMSR